MHYRCGLDGNDTYLHPSPPYLWKKKYSREILHFSVEHALLMQSKNISGCRFFLNICQQQFKNSKTKIEPVLFFFFT